MKNVKFFALMVAALTMVACGGNTEDPKDEPTAVSINMPTTQYTVEEGETIQIEYTVAPAGTTLTWTSLNPDVASVDANGAVTGVKTGNTIVTATAGSAKANCIINVKAKGAPNPGEKPTLRGSKFWPIYFDADVLEQNMGKLGFSLRTDDVVKMLYIWDNTYVGGGASGSNYFQTNMQGGFLSFRPSGDNTWSGIGFCIKKEGIAEKAQLDSLVNAIKADPSHFHLHMAIKSTFDGGSHYFTLFGLGSGNTTGLKWCVGEGYEAESNGRFDIVYDGSWQVIDFTFDRYVAALDNYTPKPETDGINYFTFGSGKDANNVLNIDAVYIYQE